MGREGGGGRRRNGISPSESPAGLHPEKVKWSQRLGLAVGDHTRVTNREKKEAFGGAHSQQAPLKTHTPGPSLAVKH